MGVVEAAPAPGPKRSQGQWLPGALAVAALVAGDGLTAAVAVLGDVVATAPGAGHQLPPHVVDHSWSQPPHQWVSVSGTYITSVSLQLGHVIDSCRPSFLLGSLDR